VGHPPQAVLLQWHGMTLALPLTFGLHTSACHFTAPILCAEEENCTPEQFYTHPNLGDRCRSSLASTSTVDIMKRASVRRPIRRSKQTARPYLSRATCILSLWKEKSHIGQQNRARAPYTTSLLAVDSVRACATPDVRGGERAGKHASARAPVCQLSPGPADPAQFPRQPSLMKWAMSVSRSDPRL
jgi:hypothetical protein